MPLDAAVVELNAADRNGAGLAPRGEYALGSAVGPQ